MALNKRTAGAPSALVAFRCDAQFVDDPKDIVRRGYDLVSRAYRADDADDSHYAAWLELIETRVAAGAPVLDLGCGCGVPVARRLARRYVVTGVASCQVHIERAGGLVPRATFCFAAKTNAPLSYR